MQRSKAMRYYVVSDPHGFYTELRTALKEKGFFEDKEPHKLIVCGDLLDRGFQAKEMEKFISDLMDKDDVILIRGNHEDLMQEFVTNIEKYMTPMVFNTHHYKNGTIDAMLQLIDADIRMVYQFPRPAAKEMKETVFYSKIMPSMLDYYETEHYIFVHGWIPCKARGYGGHATSFEPMPDWRKASKLDWDYARWYNGMDAARAGVLEEGKTIVCGHWHCSYGHAKIEGKGDEFEGNADFTPYYANGIIAIDACTSFSHRVNCIVIEDEK